MLLLLNAGDGSGFHWNMTNITSSCNEGVSFLWLISPGGRKGINFPVITSKSVNSGFNENQSELAIFICTELLNMFANVYSLLDQVIKIFRNWRSNAVDLQNSKDLWSCYSFNLGDTILISKGNTDLRRSWTTFCHLDNLLNEIVCWDLDPTWRSLSVRKTSARDTFTTWMHSAHFDFLLVNYFCLKV